jgi:hypothetical protein
MKPPDKAGMAWKAVSTLVLSVGMLAGLPGTAGAQIFNGGVIDFCNDDPATGRPYYDNAWDPTTGLDNTILSSNLPVYSYPQSFGSFTDLALTGWFTGTPLSRRNHTNMINVYRNMHSTTNLGGTNPWGDSPTKPATCALNVYGDSGKMSDGKASMWITILASPTAGQSLKAADNAGLVPKTNCWGLTATVWFDSVGATPDPYGTGGWNNSKGVGIVTNFNPQDSTGLMLALFDSGNTESLKLVQFDASVDYPNNMANPTVIASAGLTPSSISSRGDGGSTVNSLAYVVRLDICTGADPNNANAISALASVQPALSTNTPGTCPSDKPADQQCLVYNGPLPAGIIANGAVGIATLAPTSGAGVVDTYVSKFTVTSSTLEHD